MLTIRLSRVGRKNDPSFRVIVVESKRKPQPGKYTEMVGSYNPKMNRVELNAERIKHWMSQGATVSDTVHNLLVSQKIIDAKKINILPAFKAPASPEATQCAALPFESAQAAEVPTSEVGTPTESVGASAKVGEDNSVAQEAPQA